MFISLLSPVLYSAYSPLLPAHLVSCSQFSKQYLIFTRISILRGDITCGPFSCTFTIFHSLLHLLPSHFFTKSIESYPYLLVVLFFVLTRCNNLSLSNAFRDTIQEIQ